MNENWNQEPYTTSYQQNAAQAGNLQSMIASRSFLVVFIGMIVTTICAYVTVTNTSFLIDLVTGQTMVILCIVEVVAVVVSSIAISKKKLGLAVGMFVAYTILNGITMSVIFLAYDIGSIQEAFLLTCILFGVMSAFGYFTKRDMTKIGSICGMALIGVIIVSLANLIFFHNTGLDLLIDYIVVLLFVGITAYDVYKMKQMSAYATEAEVNQIALYTGMQLYLDFINLFLRLVRILGKRN